jgi:NAD(P)-dependent dehydrogenase (short-subunit alcohol dehydrogenase family)
VAIENKIMEPPPMTASHDDLNATASRRQALFGLGAMSALVAATSTAANAQTASAAPLAGKVAIVTGARNNLGRGIAVALGGMGASVVAHYHRAETKAEADETAAMITRAGGKVALFQGDLTRPEVVRAMYDQAVSQFGGVDIVSNNVGAIIKKPIADFTDAEFERLDAINNRALFYSLREAAKRIRDNGRIINMGTSLTAGAAPGYAIYSGTKAPVEEYSRMLAKELGAKKVTVNVIGPGPVDTPFFHAAENPQSVQFATNLSNERRLGKVEDIVPMIAFLARPEAQWINGQTLWINGGYLTR